MNLVIALLTLFVLVLGFFLGVCWHRSSGKLRAISAHSDANNKLENSYSLLKAALESTADGLPVEGKFYSHLNLEKALPSGLQFRIKLQVLCKRTSTFLAKRILKCRKKTFLFYLAAILCSRFWIILVFNLVFESQNQGLSSVAEL